ncbi:MAG: hypothetical protein ACLFPE_08905 [Bacteroidales bacterium]
MENIYHDIRKLTIIVCLILLYGHRSDAQVGIQTDNPDPSAALEIVSGDKGLLIPRITLTGDLSSPDPVAAPATGLLIYNTGANQETGFYYWSGAGWVMLKTYEETEMHGPGSSTDNAIARFDGVEGNLLQNSSVILDDAGNITGVNHLTTSGFTMPAGAGDGKVLGSDVAGNASWVDAVLPDIEDEDILITENVHTLNFKGAVDVQDDGGNQASVVVTESINEEQVVQVSTSRSIDLNVFGAPVAILWNIEHFKDSQTFQHHNSINSSRITVLKNGTYEVNYMFSFDNTNNKRKTLQSRIRINGTDFIDGSSTYGFIYSKDDDKASLVSSSFLVNLSAGDYIEVVVNGRTNEGIVNLIAFENLLYVRVMRTW